MLQHLVVFGIGFIQLAFQMILGGRIAFNQAFGLGIEPFKLFTERSKLIFERFLLLGQCVHTGQVVSNVFIA
ncbi:hypothetical protein BpHYR1_005143 [Brachionus plicatilis]|uniref:Uncharacterized protein n=1 Tax=Brachionus plicatilis TaxID=10195 RepID=A0A3M7SP73_BRAPC|nr:hypothetical protein BpHYR1_005143 [Brachionus plicatilis]